MNENIIANHLDHFRSDIGKFESAAGQLENSSRKLFDTLESLNASWSGAAHDEYVENVKEDEELMESVFKALISFGEELREAEVTYRTCEDNVEQEIARLRV